MDSSTVDSIHRILLFYVPQSLVLDSSFFGDTANELLGRETPDEVGWGLYGCLLSKSINGICIDQEGWEDTRYGVHLLSVAGAGWQR